MKQNGKTDQDELTPLVDQTKAEEKRKLVVYMQANFRRVRESRVGIYVLYLRLSSMFHSIQIRDILQLRNVIFMS